MWKTKDCTIKNFITKSNDLYVKGVIGDEEQETDTHYFCRGDGSFNYRMKFPMNLPIDVKENYGGNMFKISLWDQCFIGANNLIGEASIYLNDHKMLWKGYAKDETSIMRKKVLGAGNIVDKMWYKVYNPQIKDQFGKKKMQGQVLLSFKILTKEETESKETGYGRATPNVFPTLPEPVGRFNFNLFDPFGMLKMIIGPANCRKIGLFFLLMIVLSVCGFLGYLLIQFLLSFMAVKAAGA